MTTRDEFYRLIGILATSYSDLEYRSIRILELLIDPRNTLVGGIIASGMMFHGVIRQIRRVSAARFSHNSFLHSVIRHHCCELDCVRDERNLFVHGLWSMGPDSEDSAIVICQSMKWKPAKRRGGWTRAERQVWRIDTLNNRIAAVCALLEQSRDIEKNVEEYFDYRSRKQ